jgi:hypothetical protein
MEKRKYKVIVINTKNKIEVCHLFENIENAIICFREFQTRYSHYGKITIQAIQI